MYRQIVMIIPMRIGTPMVGYLQAKEGIKWAVYGRGRLSFHIPWAAYVCKAIILDDL
jgi:hypothetical protein